MTRAVHAVERPRPGALDHIPGPRGRAFVEHMLHFRRDSLGALEAALARHGPIVAFPWPVQTVLLFRPADIRHVLVERHGRYEKGAQTRELSALLGEGLVTSRDRTSWARRRALVGRALSLGSVRRCLPRVERIVDELIDALSSSTDGFDVGSTMRRLTFAISAEVLLGASVAPDDARAIDEAVLFASHVVHLHMFALVPVPYWIPTPNHLRFASHVRALDRAIAGLSARARQTKNASSVLDQLAAPADPSDALDDRALRDEIVTLLVAGYETTASALTFVLALLATHPSLRAHAEAEIDHSGIASDPATLPKTHPFLHSLLLEALRLFPSIPMTSHRALEDDVVGGYAIPKGTSVVLPLWVVHRDETHWGPRAAEVCPARFHGAHPRDAYLPFSKGERGCVGQVLAMAELAIVVSKLVSRFSIRSEEPLPRAVSEVSLRPASSVRAQLLPRAVHA